MIEGEIPSKNSKQDTVVYNTETRKAVVLPSYVYRRWIKGTGERLQPHIPSKPYDVELVTMEFVRVAPWRCNIAENLFSIMDGLESWGIIKNIRSVREMRVSVIKGEEFRSNLMLYVRDGE